ncbi:hypothetical protein CLI92_13280 [Vandammella animalimorsus]|uniref:Uncharacterized protein n=1 Tax=Vandammella animalimorsus TaxID=2029117 RepID=A0A2A2T2B1_9BURK|nr:hypothetical protein CK626_13360 [Vandammella animalimorsus]PAX15623.1 hypothetical protein CLI92_13280 [Vandammella animalimorsus]PAX17620.1 hypothetical protein CLI93_13390 [Vandammella animalimorsus]
MIHATSPKIIVFKVAQILDPEAQISPATLQGQREEQVRLIDQADMKILTDQNNASNKIRKPVVATKSTGKYPAKIIQILPLRFF